MSADLREVWKRLAAEWTLNYRIESAERCYVRWNFMQLGIPAPLPRYIRENW